MEARHIRTAQGAFQNSPPFPGRGWGRVQYNTSTTRTPLPGPLYNTLILT